jgi:hypothetical protein
MKQVFTAPSVVPCDLLKGLLEAEGIACMIKNERGSAIAGEGLPLPSSPALSWAWPEVGVNDGDFDRATAIAAEFLKTTQAWTDREEAKGT